MRVVTLTCLFCALLAVIITIPAADSAAADLHNAAAQGDTDRLADLIAKGTNVDQQDPDGRTALHWAVAFGQVEAARLLLTNGADVNAADKQQVTPLHLAAAAYMNIPLAGQRFGFEAGNRMLILDAAFAALLDTLLARGANVNVTDVNERTPLHIVAMSPTQGVLAAKRAAALLSKGALLRAKDKDGKTPDALARESKNSEVLKVLQDPQHEQQKALQAPATPNERPRAGSEKGNAAVPPTISSQISDAATVKLLLLDRGMNIVAMGWTDRDSARCGQARISQLVQGVIRKYGYKTSGEDFFVRVFGLKGVETLPPEKVEALTKRIATEVLDTPTPQHTGGSVERGGCSISIEIPERAYRLIIWPKGIDLPDVQFGPGTLRFAFNSAIVSFTDGTKCVLKGKTYVYSSGAWREE